MRQLTELEILRAEVALLKRRLAATDKCYGEMAELFHQSQANYDRLYITHRETQSELQRLRAKNDKCRRFFGRSP